LGIICSFFLGLKILAINILVVALLWFYASVFKKKPLVGNLIVAILTGLAIYEMAIFYQKNEILITIYAIFAFFINFIREIIKDIEDMTGDKIHGAKTLPIHLGVRKTKNVIYVIAWVFGVLVVTLTSLIDNKKIWIMFGFLGLMLLWFVYKLTLADRKSHFAQLSSICKYIMILGVGSMVLI
jgi:4-hydroxybenzoate polyprenyltransferase